ncbi:MAG TPA: ABC transporter permease [Candidatus Angelobacter sp.]|nr:ABC transporter permease [Candidatus Angelobacter sp.]
MQAHPQIRLLIWQCKLLLRTASLLVPKPQRAEWYREWFGEVWHWLHFLAESGRLNSHTSMQLARHCWGAFPDAAFHRFSQKKVVRAFDEVPRTARFCLGTVFFALVFLVLVTGLAPTIRSGFKPLPFHQPDRLAYLAMHGSFTKYDEENLFRATAQWAERSKTAEMVAAYSWHPVSLVFPHEVVNDISARVSPNFFDLLGNKAALGRLFTPADEANCAQCVVITDRLWKAEFNSDRNIVGKTISVDGRPGTVIGVLPESFVFTFPEVSVWLLPRWGITTNNFADRTGAVLRMQPHATLAQAKQEFRQMADHDGYSQPQMESFVSRAHQGVKLYLFFTVLSLFGGVALGSSRLGGAKTRKIKLSFAHGLRWWGFFSVKTLLLLAICFVGSLELTGRVSIMLTGSVHPLVGPFSTWLFLVTAMIALSWSLYDQGRRCRFCLRRLGNEASVGTPGYLFLGWWGTELVCSDGHGLLHVPEMKSSWQEFDQWVSLDESWKPLFEHEEPVHTP